MIKELFGKKHDENQVMQERNSLLCEINNRIQVLGKENIPIQLLEAL